MISACHSASSSASGLPKTGPNAAGAPPQQKIHSFYFLTPDDKARWMGARQTYIAKPWRHEIYIQHEEFPHATLRLRATAIRSSLRRPRRGGRATRYAPTSPRRTGVKACERSSLRETIRC